MVNPRMQPHPRSGNLRVVEHHAALVDFAFANHFDGVGVAMHAPAFVAPRHLRQSVGAIEIELL